MTLALNTNWLERARASTKDLVLLAAITKGADTWKFLDKPSSVFHYDIGLDSVAPIVVGVDVLTRKSAVDEQQVRLRDPAVRSLVSGTRLRGGKMSLKMGFADLDESDYVDLWGGVIEGTHVDEDRQGVRLECLTIMEILRLHRITGAWRGQHPLDVIYDILTNADTQKGLALDSSMIDAASFDPDASANAAFGHFVGGWYNGHGYIRAVTEPTPAFELIDALMAHLPGMLRISESGVISFKAFDASASPAATWTTDHISKLRQTKLDEDIVNQVTWAIGGAFRHATGAGENTRGVDPEAGLVRNDVTSQADHAYPGMSKRVFSHARASSFIVAGAEISGTGLAAGTTSDFLILDRGGSIGSLSGTREATPGPQPANATISADRPLYLLTNNGEIIKATSLTQSLGTSTEVIYTEVQGPAGGLGIEIPVDERRLYGWLVGGVTRGFDGPSSAAATHVFDITIPMILSEMLLKRHSHGVPIIEVITSLAEWGNQFGDFVRITWPDYLGFGRDGLLSTDGTWEIIAKEFDPADPEAGVRWQLAWTAEASPSTSSRAQSGLRDASSIGMSGALSAEEDVAQKFILSGLGITHSSLLDVTVAAGIVTNGLMRKRYAEATLTLPASKDCYITAEIQVAALHVYPVSNGAAEPSYGNTEVKVGKVVTDATTVGSIDTTTGVPRKAISGVKLLDASVPTAAYAVGSVDAAALGAAAVTAPAIASAAVATQHVVTSEPFVNMFRNADFSITRKGK